MNLSIKEIFAYNDGLKRSQSIITKTMLAMKFNGDLTEEIKSILRFMHDEIEKELK
jgi:hypothetical protein